MQAPLESRSATALANRTVVPAQPVPAHYAVVGVATYAANSEPVAEFLKNLPPNPALAIVVLPHLTSALTHLAADLRPVTTLAVVEVSEGQRLEPNTLYVIPPKAVVQIKAGVFQGAPNGSKQPVDTFFSSLAEEYGKCAIGVSLSEPAWDGATGLRDIQTHGGITFLDGSLYRRSSLPENLMAAIDSVHAPAQIAHEVVRLARQSCVLSDQAQPFAAEDIAELRAVLMTRSGLDCTIYHPQHLVAKINRRMALGGLSGLKDYYEQIRADQTEREALVGDLCARPAGFFREAGLLEYLKAKFFPLILQARAASTAVRIWVPECSHGEDLYSVAIALFEYMEEQGVRHPVQIFGTDLNEAALEVARAGVYSESVAGTLSSERLSGFFRKTHGGYRIIPAIRAFCLFSKHNLAEDPPFPRLDLIVCRHVLPQLTAAAQHQALRGFHYALQPRGALLLGSSKEPPPPELFAKARGRHSVYSRQQQGVVSNSSPRLAPMAQPGQQDANLRARVMQTLLSRYGPRFFVVDRDLRLVPLDGALKENNLPRMPGGLLAAELQKLIHRAQRRGAAIFGEVLRSGSEPHRHVRPVVVPLASSDSAYYLVAFENAEAAIEPVKPAAGASRMDMQRLEQDLASVSAELQSMIEEQQAVIEELKAAYEEIATSNEELVATNNELVFARKDLEANNHELAALNEEIAARHNDLIRLNRDLNSLLRNLSIPMITVGNDLRIRRFTPQVRHFVELTADDIGRPVGGLKLRFDVGDLEQLFREAVDHLKATEQLVRDENGRAYRLSIRPYRSEDDIIEGAILTLL